MPVYKTIPTKNEWEKDMGFHDTFFAAKRFPAAQEIGELLGLIPTLDQLNPGEFFIRQQAVAHIWMMSDASLRWNAKKKTDKLGAKLKEQQIESLYALMVVTREHLKLVLGTDEAGLRAAILDRFGREVGAHEKAQDAVMSANNTMQWIGAANRKAYKLHFRDGLGSRDRINGDRISREPYDSAAWGDDVEAGQASVYVMDGRYHIYVGGNQANGEMKHSSFLQGEATLAAGTMRWANGRLVFITPMSGHYKPTLQQMLNILERLSALQGAASGRPVLPDQLLRRLHRHAEGGREICGWPPRRPPGAVQRAALLAGEAVSRDPPERAVHRPRRQPPGLTETAAKRHA
jgi:hypothetical protein